MTGREHVVRIVHQELVKSLGTPRALNLKSQKIMLVGLYGQGKTTTCGKLAKYFQRKGMSVGLIAADVHRPAAFDQLSQLGEKLNVPVYGEKKSKIAPELVKNGMKELAEREILIIDTAGRHSLDDELISELNDLS